ncbi:MAG: polysaccharide biosynthesis tyrosine autokinase [Bacillota bacterium]|nr:polysaccharide biosynthesis tyrosine autokinase [Bacillota bacterium]
MDENNEMHSVENRSIHPMLMLWELVRKLWVVILVAVIAASCTYVACSAVYSPEYCTKTTFVVSVRDGAGSVYSNLNAAQSLADAFSQILNSDSMRKFVSEELGTENFNGSISAEVIEETNLLEMVVVAGSPREAFLITKAVLANYEELADTILDNIALDILQSPTVPVAPTNSSGAVRYAKLAALGSAAAVIAWLCIRVYLRDTVKSVEEVEEKLDAKLLATIYHERKRKSVKDYFDRKKRSILISDPTTSFSFVETYKKLRTRVDYHMRKENCKTIMITSVHENEGKSTVAVNLALAMNHKKKSVLLIDADMKKPAIHKILGYKNKKYHSIVELVTGKATLAQTLITDKERHIGLILGENGTDKSTEYISSPNMKSLVEQAGKNVDVVIIDTPPMAVSTDAECLCDLVDAAILVVRQDQTPARIINDAVDAINAMDTNLMGCVFNNVRAADFSDNYSYGSGGKYGYGGRHYGKYGYSKYGYGKYGYGRREKKTEDNRE